MLIALLHIYLRVPSGQNFYWPTYADDGRSSGQGDNARTRPTVRPEIGRTWQILGRTVGQRLARQMARRCYAYAYLGPYRRPTSGPINGQMRRNSMLLSVDFREIFPAPNAAPRTGAPPPAGDRNRSPPSWVPIIQTHNSNQIYRQTFPRALGQGREGPPRGSLPPYSPPTGAQGKLIGMFLVCIMIIFNRQLG